MPGSADRNPSTTRRRRGVTDTMRSSRRMRMARRTDSPCVAGISAIPTTMKSNTFQPSRKNRSPRA